MIIKFWKFTIMIIISLLILNVSFIKADQYNKVISRANIFYISPEPNTINPEVIISKLSKVNNRTDITILIHGYISSKDHVSIQPIRFAYLTKGYNSLYIADWSETAKIFYYSSRYLVKRIGKRFAKILFEFISKHDIQPESLHIIGHSLGAHIAGIIGKSFQGKIGRITGLDPALPLFEGNPPDAIRQTDAKFVDIIHSDGPVLGISNPIGHADFYPNYGIYPQPGCSTLDLITLTSCSHFRAPLFYAETIQLPKNFPAIKCPIKAIEKNNCENLEKLEIVTMGEELSRSTRGTFYLTTTNVPPYGKGKFSKFMAPNGGGSLANGGNMTATTQTTLISVR